MKVVPDYQLAQPVADVLRKSFRQQLVNHFSGPEPKPRVGIVFPQINSGASPDRLGYRSINSLSLRPCKYASDSGVPWRICIATPTASGNTAGKCIDPCQHLSDFRIIQWAGYAL